MASVDISEGARELVDISAEHVGTLGEHLKQIGDLIAESTQPPKKGVPRSTARKVRDKLEMYKAYCEDVARRKAEIEKKTEEDFERIRAWRKECGTEGSTLVEELEQLYDKVREQKHIIEEEQRKLAEEKEKVAELTAIGLKKDAKMRELGEIVVHKKELLRSDRAMRAGVCSWLQCTFDNIRFQFKADQEREKLKIEHHRRLRKRAAEDRLKVIQRERLKRLIQNCVLAMQEETVECRAQRHLEELRRRYEDHVLVLEAQLAMALGDEEKAKQLVQEQVRRMEEEKRKAREAERAMKNAQKDARKAREERDIALEERDAARLAEAIAKKAREEAEADAAQARKERDEANRRSEEYLEAMQKAEKAQRDLEDLMRKKNKKIASLQRMLVELGAESDSDAPPDERPPAFFVNEDGTKVPRPRTRKERMNMAYREAESARWELRLGMAAMVDKEVANKAAMTKVVTELKTSQQEVQEVRWANKVLHADLEALAAEAAAAQAAAAAAAAKQPQPCPICLNKDQLRPASARDLDLVHAPLPVPPAVPLAPSTSAVPPWSPARPHFGQGKLDPSRPGQLLTKTASQPLMMPPLTGEPPVASPPERLAPLRKLKRPPADWRIGWH